MMRRVIYALIIMALPYHAMGQYLRLSRASATNAFYLNMSRIYNYNRYDGPHFEGNFYHVYPSDLKPGNESRPQWQNTAYCGYGLRSAILSYGANVALQTRGLKQWRFGVSYDHKLEPAGRIMPAKYNMFRLADNSGYRSDRFSETHKATLTLSGMPNGRLSSSVTLTHSLERLLFDANGSRLYGNEQGLNDWRHYTEIRWQSTYHNRLTLNLEVGVADKNDGDEGGQCFAKAVIQYDHTHKIGERLKMRLFAQGGAATLQTPLSRVFDISGTYENLFFFNNTFVTIVPNEFHAHLFAKGFARIQSASPLWDTWYSAPTPFVQVGVMYGWIDNGQRLAAHASVEGMTLDAPTQGLIEPALGTEKIIKLGILNIGGAIAYRVVPDGAFYQQRNQRKNLAIMFIANIEV